MKTNVFMFMIATWITQAAVAQTPYFPADDAYVPFTCFGEPAVDPVGDDSGGIKYRDVVGDVSHPALLRASDGVYLYLRMRLDDDPVQSPGELKPFGWGWELDQDGILTTYEHVLMIDATGTDSPNESDDEELFRRANRPGCFANGNDGGESGNVQAGGGTDEGNESKRPRTDGRGLRCQWWCGLSLLAVWDCAGHR